jgi:hypothetical protein
LVQSLYFSFSTHKQRTPIRFYTTPLLCLPKKPDTLAGFEPGSSVPTPPGQKSFLGIYRWNKVKTQQFFGIKNLPCPFAANPQKALKTTSNAFIEYQMTPWVAAKLGLSQCTDSWKTKAGFFVDNKVCNGGTMYAIVSISILLNHMSHVIPTYILLPNPVPLLPPIVYLTYPTLAVS